MRKSPAHCHPERAQRVEGSAPPRSPRRSFTRRRGGSRRHGGQLSRSSSAHWRTVPLHPRPQNLDGQAERFFRRAPRLRGPGCWWPPLAHRSAPPRENPGQAGASRGRHPTHQLTNSPTHEEIEGSALLPSQPLRLRSSADPSIRSARVCGSRSSLPHPRLPSSPPLTPRATSSATRSRSRTASSIHPRRSACADTPARRARASGRSSPVSRQP